MWKLFCFVLQIALYLQYYCRKYCLNMSQSTVTIRVDERLKKNFDSLCDQFGFSNTAAFTIFMKAVVRERRIPFEIKVDSDEQIREKAVRAFAQMRQDVASSGTPELSLDEINAIISETRNAR